jgi:hypothetical protein
MDTQSIAKTFFPESCKIVLGQFCPKRRSIPLIGFNNNWHFRTQTYTGRKITRCTPSGVRSHAYFCSALSPVGSVQ